MNVHPVVIHFEAFQPEWKMSPRYKKVRCHQRGDKTRRKASLCLARTFRGKTFDFSRFANGTESTKKRKEQIPGIVTQTTVKMTAANSYQFQLTIGFILINALHASPDVSVPAETKATLSSNLVELVKPRNNDGKRSVVTPES